MPLFKKDENIKPCFNPALGAKYELAPLEKNHSGFRKSGACYT